MMSAKGKFSVLEREYVIFFLKRFPVVATYLGAKDFDPALQGIDGMLRDYSPLGIGEEDRELLRFRRCFHPIADGELPSRQRVDRRVAVAQIDFLLRLHQVRRHQERCIDNYLEEPFCGVDWHIRTMVSADVETFGLLEEWRTLAERVRAIPTFLRIGTEQIDAGVHSGNTPDWRMLIHSGLGTAAEGARYFAKTLPEIARKYLAGKCLDSPLEEIERGCTDASAAYFAFRDYLVDTFFEDPARTDIYALKEAFRVDRYALGEEEYNWALGNNLALNTTARQLYEGSWSWVRETRMDVVALAREISGVRGWKVPTGDDGVVRAVFDRLSEEAPSTDTEMLDSYRGVTRRLVNYGRATGLFVVPDHYDIKVTETPVMLRPGLDAAAYFPAPPFRNSGDGSFYVTPTGDNLSQLRHQHNTHAIAYVAAHEGFPGHDWHYRLMVEWRDEISPLRWLTPGGVSDSSSMWADSMVTEGWGLYCEGLISERRSGAPNGFYSAEERLYQLRGLLYRNLRVRIDTGLHIGCLGFEDAVTLFSEVTDFIPGPCSATTMLLDTKCASCKAARAAVTRYSRWPTQAITYRLGRDQILDLRARARRELGSAFSEQQFHLELMKQGPVAVSYFADDLIFSLKGGKFAE